MTRKETILREVYIIRNLIAEVKGNEQTNIDELVKTWKFKDEAKRWKEYELKIRVEQMQELLEIAKKDQLMKNSADEFYSTPEGEEFKRATEQALAEVQRTYEETKLQVAADIKAELQKQIGKDWTIGYLGDECITIGIINPEKPEDTIFGQRADIRFKKDDWNYGDKVDRFEINIGTCGSHDLMPQQLAGSFANFYIGIGKLHTNTEFLTWLKDILFGYAERNTELRKEYNELESKLENPLNA